MSKGSVYVRNPTVYRIPSFRIQLHMEPLGNTCMRIHLYTVYTLLENSERFRVSSYLPGSHPLLDRCTFYTSPSRVAGMSMCSTVVNLS